MADEPIGNDTLKRLLELFDSEDATRFSPKVARLRSAIFTTTCAACGRPLDDTLHRCEQCGTRYCSAECEQGNSGHSEFCETTALAGNPIKLWIKPLLEKHERLAIAACGATSDARCYICLEGGDLVRGCACRGNSGFVHLKCMIDHGNSIEVRPGWSILEHWCRCLYCKQKFHSSVGCSMAVACWALHYHRQPERDEIRLRALEILGDGLRLGNEPEFALIVYQQLLLYRESNGPADDRFRLLITQHKMIDAIAHVGGAELANKLRKLQHEHNNEIVKGVEGLKSCSNLRLQIALCARIYVFKLDYLEVLRSGPNLFAENFLASNDPQALATKLDFLEISHIKHGAFDEYQRFKLRFALAKAMTSCIPFPGPFTDSFMSVQQPQLRFARCLNMLCEAEAYWSDIYWKAMQTFGEKHPHTIRVHNERQRVSKALKYWFWASAANVFGRRRRKCVQRQWMGGELEEPELKGVWMEHVYLDLDAFLAEYLGQPIWIEEFIVRVWKAQEIQCSGQIGYVNTKSEKKSLTWPPPAVEQNFTKVQVSAPPHAVPGEHCNLTLPSGTRTRVMIPDGHGPGSLLELYDVTNGVLPATRAWAC